MSLQKQLLIWVLGCVLAVGLLVQAVVFWHTYQKFSQSQDNNLSYIAELVGSRSTFRPSKNNDLERPIQPTDLPSAKHDISPNENNPQSAQPPLRQPSVMKYGVNQNTNIQSEQPNIAKKYDDNLDIISDANNEDNGVLQYQGIEDGIQVDIIPIRVKRAGKMLSIPADYNQLMTLPTGFSQVNLTGKVWKVFRKDTPRRIIFVRQPMDWQKKATLQSAWQAIIPILVSVSMLLFLLPLILKKVLRPVQSLAAQMATRDEFDLSPINIASQDKQSALPEELSPLVNEINNLLSRIDKHIKGQNRFIANVAHELRSPLTAISLQAQSLQKQLSQNARYNDLLWRQKLHQNVEKLVVRIENNQNLVEQLLTFARVDAQQPREGSQLNNKISIMPTLIEAVTWLFPIADNKDINLAIDNQLGEQVEQECWQIAMDETSLLVLLKNLIQNAILYTPNLGSVSVVVTSTEAIDLAQYDHQIFIPRQHTSKPIKNPSIPASPRLVVQIIDTGVGIPKAQYQSVLQPFVRLSESGDESRNDSLQKTSGTGLGLSIVYHICQQANIDMYFSDTEFKHHNPAKATGLTVTLVF